MRSKADAHPCTIHTHTHEPPLPPRTPGSPPHTHAYVRRHFCHGLRGASRAGFTGYSDRAEGQVSDVMRIVDPPAVNCAAFRTVPRPTRHGRLPLKQVMVVMVGAGDAGADAAAGRAFAEPLGEPH